MSPAVSARERLQRTERFIAFIRAAVIAFNIVAYLTVGSHGERHDFAVIVCVAAAVYAIASLLWNPPPATSMASAVATTLLDNVFILVWLWATGGAASPFYPLIYAEAAATIGRFGPIFGWFAAMGSAGWYVALVAIDGGWSRYVTPVRVGYIFAIAAFCAYVVDISRKSEREVIVAEKESAALQELDRLRNEMVTNIAHELRTPLASIRGASTTLSSRWTDLPDDQRAILMDILERQSVHLADVVQDIIDMSTIGEGPSSLRFEHADLQEIVAGQVAVTGAPERIVFVPAPGDLTVWCDRSKVGTAVRKLVENALKFSAKDALVQVEIVQEENGLRIDVADHGVGIAPEDTDRIFERFFQVDGSATRTADGTGIGLSLARSLIEMHGGTLTVASEVGHGSRFSIRLPRRSIVLPDQATDSPSPGTGRISAVPPAG